MESMLITAFGTVVTLLFAGNIFFIKRLVEKLESTSISALSMATKVETFGQQLTDIKSEIKSLRQIEIEVAVLKAQIRPLPATTP